MKRATLIVALILIGLVSLPLAWALFPWAQSLSAVEFADGTKALVSINSGRWIITVGTIISGCSFVGAIGVGLFYKHAPNESE